MERRATSLIFSELKILSAAIFRWGCRLPEYSETGPLSSELKIQVMQYALSGAGGAGEVARTLTGVTFGRALAANIVGNSTEKAINKINEAISARIRYEFIETSKHVAADNHPAPQAPRYLEQREATACLNTGSRCHVV